MKTVITTLDAPAAVGPYSQAIKANNFVYTAGQLGLNPETGKFVSGDVAAQARQAMLNLQALLEQAGSRLSQIVKTTIFLADINDFKAVNAVYGEFFEGAPPARSTVQVAALPMAGLVEIEAVAVVA